MWLILIISLPTENGTVRQRAWRSLKAAGSVALRDGVYLLPDRAQCRALLEPVADDVVSAGGVAHLLTGQAADDIAYASLFDRQTEYAQLLAEASLLRESVTSESAPDAIKRTRKLRKGFEAIVAIDFFPGESKTQVERELSTLEAYCARLQSPDEPQPIEELGSPLSTADFVGKVWATRRRPWVDRLASAWLIRRHIDPEARFLWLSAPADCPSDALGFDFDGATFTHVGNRVTFEVIAARFSLEQAGISRMGQLVHFLDVGGVQPPEALGVESILAGLRDLAADDDVLLDQACAVFDGLHTRFCKEQMTP